MLILAIEHEHPNLTAADFQPHLRAEARRAWELHQGGQIRALYFCPERSAAVLMLECEDLDAARRLLDTLPLVQAGLIRFELLALTAYPGFARLFHNE
jgi:muconolactone delta-isomerase